MNGPWDSYAPGTPESRSENWTQRVDDQGNAYWSYLGGGPGLTYDATLPPADYGMAPAQPAYNITGGGDYTGLAPAGAPAQPAYDPLSSAYPTPAPTYGAGTPGTGSNMANPYDPSQAAAGEQAAYETLLANGGIPLVGGAPTAPTDPSTGVPAADPYAAPAATDPYTGLPVYEPAYSVGEPYSASGGYDAGFGGGGYGGADPSFGATYPYPSFGQSAMNPGRQQPVVPGQFDPFAWSGNPNPMPAPNETRQMILGAMQLGAEIEQQRAQQPVMTAQNYALHRLGLNKPEEPTPQMPVTPPQRSRFGL